LNLFTSRYQWTSPLTDALATTILEDKEFYTRFLEESVSALRENHSVAVALLDSAEIPYVRKA
jgi:hypothetical protein